MPASIRGEVLPGVLARLQRYRSELGEHVARLRIGDPGDVADGEHLRVPLEAEIGADRDPIAPLELDPDRARQRVGLQARAPDERVRLELLART